MCAMSGHRLGRHMGRGRGSGWGGGVTRRHSPAHLLSSASHLAHDLGDGLVRERVEDSVRADDEVLVVRRQLDFGHLGDCGKPRALVLQREVVSSAQRQSDGIRSHQWHSDAITFHGKSPQSPSNHAITAQSRRNHGAITQSPSTGSRRGCARASGRPRHDHP